VELLVVIGIIAILIGILLPALSKARAISRRTACLSNMRQMGMGLQIFAQEHDLYLPKAWFNSGPTPGAMSLADTTNYTALKESWGFRDPMWGWDFLLLKYVKGNKEVFRCPSDESDFLRGRWTTSATPGLTEPPEADDIPASYRMNVSNQSDPFRAVKLTQIRNSSQAILLVEGNPWAFHHIATWEPGDQPIGAEGKVGKFNRENMAYKRHPKELNNYTFADGHAEAMAWFDTWKTIGPPPAAGQNAWGSAHRGITMWRNRYAPAVVQAGPFPLENGVKPDIFYAPPLKPAD
jgi:prepilin-type processing-associated H-X9-DG protein